jgi:hypothetical protein
MSAFQVESKGVKEERRRQPKGKTRKNRSEIRTAHSLSYNAVVIDG